MGSHYVMGVNRRLCVQADQNLAALARAVELEPGLTVLEYGQRLQNQVSWMHPAAAIHQHIRSGLGALGRHGLVHRDGRLWPATTR